MNKKQIIGLVVTVAIIAMAVVVLVLVTGSKEDGGEQNLNSNVTNNNVVNNNNESDSNQNNKYDVITEDVVRNHKVTPISDFTYAEIAGGIEIRNYNGTDDIVVIPETINGQNVIRVGGMVFANESTVRGIYIPNTVKEISTICGNNKYVEVVVCEGVEIIADNAFNNCPSLTTVVLGNSLKSIGENAFFFCSNLKELYIAPTLTTIDTTIAPTIFYLCDSLTLHGKAGSYIETFAKEQNIPFVAE